MITPSHFLSISHFSSRLKIVFFFLWLRNMPRTKMQRVARWPFENNTYVCIYVRSYISIYAYTRVLYQRNSYRRITDMYNQGYARPTRQHHLVFFRSIFSRMIFLYFGFHSYPSFLALRLSPPFFVRTVLSTDGQTRRLNTESFTQDQLLGARSIVSLIRMVPKILRSNRFVRTPLFKRVQ